MPRWTFLCLAILLLVSSSLADTSQFDCQDNEVYVHCGRCEGTCDEPIIEDCSDDCALARCECQASEGYVRGRHGHCILLEDCPGPDILSLDPVLGKRWKSKGRQSATSTDYSRK